MVCSIRPSIFNTSSKGTVQRQDNKLILAENRSNAISKVTSTTFVAFFCLLVAGVPSAAAFSRESLVRTKTSTKLSLGLDMPGYQAPQYCASRLYTLQKELRISSTLLELSRDRSNELEGEDEEMDLEMVEKRRLGKKEGRRFRSGGGRGFARHRGGANATTAVMDVPQAAVAPSPSPQEIEVAKRVTQLEYLVAKQTVEIRRLQDECRKLTEVSETFANVVELLKEAGLQMDDTPITPAAAEEEQQSTDAILKETYFMEETKADGAGENVVYEYFDDTEIFGEAPSSVTDAADAAGAAILAGILGGKKRMLVDVRDSELSRDPETLVNFIELAILPVAAGLEGLKSNRNRVKIVFPTVSQLLEYRRTMALAAPEVVALSTLGFDPVEEKDNIVVIVAPPPNDEEGLETMNELLNPLGRNTGPQITQPVVVLNHHMVPVSGPAADFDVMYHLRLLSVQYMSGDKADEIFQPFEDMKSEQGGLEGSMEGANFTNSDDGTEKPDEALLEAAMKHAHEAGVHHGVTRAMVIRAYPKPWHVFVDVSPDTDADFVVADTFTEEPTSEEVNHAIVECLEGSEREDELVAQQMQQALDMENGNIDFRRKNGVTEGEDADDNEAGDDDEFDDWYDLWNEDSV